MTPESLAALTNKLIAEATRLSLDKLVGGSEYEFDFMGILLRMRVHASVELARHHVAAMVKTLAVSVGVLGQMAMEKEILGTPAAPALTREISGSVVEPFAAVRAMMDSMMAKKEFSSPGAVSAFMESKQALWWNVDPTFVLEVGYVKALSGKQGGDLLMEQATRMLPDGIKVREFVPCLIKLRGLASSTACLFASPRARGLVNAIIDIIGNMERGQGLNAAEFPVKSCME